MVSIEVLKDNNSTIIDFGANSKIDDRKPEEPDRSCNVCGFGPCKTRCSLCKSVYYCSTECQRKDWIKGGHRINCTGRKKSKKGVKQTKNQIPIGPLPPPPTSVRNEHDAKTALEELWSFTDTAISGVEHQNGDAQKIKPKLSSEIKNRPQTKRQTPTVTTRAQSDMNRSDLGVDDCQHDSIATSCEEEAGNDVSFVVEEMPQICCFQLTLTKQRKRQRNETSNTYSLRLQTSIAVSIQPLGQARSRTLVTVRATEGQLFAGEFPRPIQKSDITWTISENKNSVALDDESQIGDVMIVLRLPYPYDASNTSSMALGGSLDDSYNYASLSESTLDEINSVVCGACHLPLIAKNAKHKPIARAFPLPQGHWDEIADYLICYDGQPMIDFSAGSECAEPSIALQDSSLLCIHRKDVEAAVCALAVDGYGELTEEMESKNELGSTPTNMDGNDFGTFSAKPASSSFVLPYEPKSTDEIKPATETANTSNGNTKNNEPEISASSAVVRGDRTWQDAVDGESVSLCCARCSSPLGFCSLGSPETWRFWKHRLSIPESTARTQQNNEQPKLRYPMTLPFTKPLAACSSFLARELVRYAESKAIFTFVVRREELNHNPSCTEMENECLLLRLLSWETAMATSFESKPNSKRLRFCKVAKIVFELASDPTVTRLETKHDFNGEVPAQWFWGGVDLCCPPAGNMLNTSTDIDDAPSAGAVSTVRLQLPSDDYDSVLKDLVSNKALFEPEIAKATILLKMGGLSEGLGLTAVPLH